MVAPFVLNTKAEFLKSKRTAALWLTIGAAAFIPVVDCIKLFARPKIFIPIYSKDPWLILFTDNWKAAAFFLLPMFVILMTSLVVQTEYRNNTWKQVYASPRTFADIYFSRFIVIHSLLLFALVLFDLFIVLGGFITGLFYPRYAFLNHGLPWNTMLSTMANMYFSILAITSIQYWLSLRFRNFIVPMGIGLGLLITGFIIHEWEHLYTDPYMYPLILFLEDFKRKAGFVFKAQLYDLAWFVIVLLIGYADMVTRKERG